MGQELLLSQSPAATVAGSTLSGLMSGQSICEDVPLGSEIVWASLEDLKS